MPYRDARACAQTTGIPSGIGLALVLAHADAEARETHTPTHTRRARCAEPIRERRADGGGLLRGCAERGSPRTPQTLSSVLSTVLSLITRKP